MVDRNKNQRPRGKYFLDRRDFVRPSSNAKGKTALPSNPMFPPPEPSSEQPDEKEVESKLKALYDSLNTSFWDTEPKLKKRREKKQSHHSESSEPRESRVSSLKSYISDTVLRQKKVVEELGYKRVMSQKKVTFPVVVLVAVLALVFMFGGGGEQKSGSIASVKGSSKINYENAGYTPMLPKAASKRDVVEAALKYEPGKKVFSYNDSLAGGKGIVASQQPLPGEYKNDPISGLTAIASNIGASDWLATSKGKMYYGKNSSGDGQMVIFTYRNILMLMRSGSEINPMTWKNYVDSLE